MMTQRGMAARRAGRKVGKRGGFESALSKQTRQNLETTVFSVLHGELIFPCIEQ